jgi:hypothetical protein
VDTRLEKALEISKFRRTLYLEKLRLQEKLKSDLTIGYNGGRFYIDRNLIVFLNLITPVEGTNSVILLDDTQNPIRVDDLVKFREQITNTYFTVINQYTLDIDALKKKRTIKAIVNL